MNDKAPSDLGLIFFAFQSIHLKYVANSTLDSIACCRCLKNTLENYNHMLLSAICKYR